MHKSPDRRSIRTQKALKHAMLDLLGKKEISKITVSELAELADIGRGTFYLHYTDPYDLLEKIEEEILRQITANTSLITEHWDNDILLTYLENVWRYIYGNRDTFMVMMSPWNRVRFMDKFKRYCEQSTLAAISQVIKPGSEEYYGAVYIISGTIGVFQCWIEDGMSIPPDQLAKTVRNLISG